MINDSTVEKVDFLTAVSANADSLESYLIQLSQTLHKTLPIMTDRVNWLLLQFSTLPEEQQQFMQQQIFKFHEILHSQISEFVADTETANQLAWLVFSAFFGYEQIFSRMGIGNVVDLGMEEYGRFLAKMITSANG